MRSVFLVIVFSYLSSCLPPPIPPPTPGPCLPDIPWCKDVGQTCSTPTSQCKHNPTSNPNHCEIAPDCPTPPEEPSCPYELPNADVRMGARHFGQGLDSTVKFCPGNDWCIDHTGKDQRCCPPAPEGAEYETACNQVLLKQKCPSWEYNVDVVWKPCISPQHPEMSCDHFDHDDPMTPNKYEGTHPECLEDFNPVETGYWVVAHGKGLVRACTGDGICSNAVNVDH